MSLLKKPGFIGGIMKEITYLIGDLTAPETDNCFWACGKNDDFRG